MGQIAHRLPDTAGGFLNGHRFLVLDRDSKFSPQFNRVVKDAGVDPILCPRKLPVAAPTPRIEAAWRRGSRPWCSSDSSVEIWCSSLSRDWLRSRRRTRSWICSAKRSMSSSSIEDAS
jgi:hypothetical protein